MLLSNPLAISTDLDLYCLRQASQYGIRRIELQLSEETCTVREFKDLIHLAQATPIAYHAPLKLSLGTNEFSLDKWTPWFEVIGQEETQYLITQGAKVALGTIFEYLDAHPKDFHALQDFKTEYVERVTEQLIRLQEHASKYNIQLLLENAPMVGENYFEPGRSELYPALRTPNHLVQIANATGVKLCFNTANARSTSHVLSYMHRSRSIFAGATETEIQYAPRTWIEFYEKIKTHVGYIRLSYATSWGDTKETSYISFPPTAYNELLSFAEKVHPGTPITLQIRHVDSHLPTMLDTLHALKR